MKILVTGDKPSENAGPTYGVNLGVEFRINKKRFDTTGSCGSIHDQMSPGEKGAVAHCGVACDGGPIDFTLKDQATVLVAIPRGASTSSATGDHDGPRFGADDKTFLLFRTALTECLSLDPEPDVQRALRNED